MDTADRSGCDFAATINRLLFKLDPDRYSYKRQSSAIVPPMLRFMASPTGVYFQRDDYAGFWRRLLIDSVDLIVIGVNCPTSIAVCRCFPRPPVCS